jgi:hypothetical protein
MHVSEAMHKGARTVPPTASVADIAQIMKVDGPRRDVVESSLLPCG